MLVIREELVGTWPVPSVLFDPEDLRLPIRVVGVIGNSVPTSETGKRRLVEWKQAVTIAAKAARGALPLDPHWDLLDFGGIQLSRIDPRESGVRRRELPKTDVRRSRSRFVLRTGARPSGDRSIQSGGFQLPFPLRSPTGGCPLRS